MMAEIYARTRPRCRGEDQPPSEIVRTKVVTRVSLRAWVVVRETQGLLMFETGRPQIRRSVHRF